jgi:hypothetical protein
VLSLRVSEKRVTRITIEYCALDMTPRSAPNVGDCGVQLRAYAGSIEVDKVALLGLEPWKCARVSECQRAIRGEEFRRRRSRR